MKYWNQRGDTIVEVLIAMSVVSMILGGAYASVSRSTILTRTAQERGEALQLLQGQLERLKAVNPADVSRDVTIPFCVSDSNARVDLDPPYPPASVTNDSWSTYPNSVPTASCVKAPQSGVDYHLAISRTVAAEPNKFTLYARWDGLSNLKQEVRLEYRFYP